MMAVGVVKRALFMGLTAAVLAGCGGGGSSGGSGEAPGPGNGGGVGSGNGGPIPVPTAPSVTLTPESTKQFLFTWEDVANEAEYRLFERPNSMSGYTQVAVIPADAESYSHTVFLPERVNASYLLQACNSDEVCTDSEAQFVSLVSGSLVDAVGYVKASNSEADDEFGGSIALSGDGRTLAVGAHREDSAATGPKGGEESDNLARYAGAVYVFTRVDGGEWSQQAYVKASNTGAYDRFGASLALSGDGHTLAVGAYGEASAAGGGQTDNLAPESGAVYLFTRADDGEWSQQDYLKASNAELSDRFGWSLALSGDGHTLAVGALGEDNAATGGQSDNSVTDSGAVYVFRRAEGGEWPQQAYVKALNAEAYDYFGRSLALSGDGNTLAVGAYGEDGAATGGQGNNSVTDSGAVYVFTRADGGEWPQQDYLKASNAEAGDEFGSSLALSGDGKTLAVGAPGEDSAASVGESDNSAQNSGAVYVFRRADGGGWSQPAYVKAWNSEAFDQFGTVSLSGDGNTLAVGAIGESSTATGLNGDESVNSGFYSGAVYVFTRVDSRWAKQAYVKASNTDGEDVFGSYVALSGDGKTLAVGAYGESSAATGIDGDQSDNSAEYSGAVYLY